MHLERRSGASPGAPPPYPHWFSGSAVASSGPEVSHGRTPTDVLTNLLEEVLVGQQPPIGPASDIDGFPGRFGQPSRGVPRQGLRRRDWEQKWLLLRGGDGLQSSLVGTPSGLVDPRHTGPEQFRRRRTPLDAGGQTAIQSRSLLCLGAVGHQGGFCTFVPQAIRRRIGHPEPLLSLPLLTRMCHVQKGVE
jgi:hypothetical protein